MVSALQMLGEAEKELKKTDHWIALGNIESARGRIVRRHGDYAMVGLAACARARLEK